MYKLYSKKIIILNRMEFNMTLKDIAEMAGVSTMTVSNVINGKTSRVSQKTRDKINSIIVFQTIPHTLSELLHF